jgi:hypothetical protein
MVDLYVGRAAVQRALQLDRKGVERLVASGHIGTRELPGLPVRFRQSDVEALLERSTRPATATARA